MAKVFVTCLEKNILRGYNSHCYEILQVELGQGVVGDDCNAVAPVIGVRNLLVDEQDIKLNIDRQILI